MQFAAASLACLNALLVLALCAEEDPKVPTVPEFFLSLRTSNAACTARNSSSEPPLSGWHSSTFLCQDRLMILNSSSMFSALENASEGSSMPRVMRQPRTVSPMKVRAFFWRPPPPAFFFFFGGMTTRGVHKGVHPPRQDARFQVRWATSEARNSVTTTLWESVKINRGFLVNCGPIITFFRWITWRSMIG